MKLVAPALLAALVGAAVAAAAPPGTVVALPSPVAPLSASPPLGGGATATSEIIRHRVNARTRVDVAIDTTGTPFRVVATQRLDVRVTGDYLFTIGAPLRAVEAAPGSESTPGLRSTAITWAGFNPGRRTLVARATLDPAGAAPSLPLRVEPARGRITLVNATAMTVASYGAAVVAPPLRAYFAELRRAADAGVIPPSGAARVTTVTSPTRVRVVAPLHVSGVVGNRRLDTILEGRLTVRGSGPLRLIVTPARPARLLDAPVAGLVGRPLLDRVSRTVLTLARAQQYRSFLGNPDPAGRSATTYVYRTAARPSPPPVAAAGRAARNRGSTAAVAAGLLLALVAGAVVWSRS
ncbi:MAG: hypothetical protein ACJ77E_07450 [Gaiellaceae bacterium]